MTIAPPSEPMRHHQERADAAIIPFPVRPRPAAPIVEENQAGLDVEDRLARAIASLNQAMTEQRVAVQRWRQVLGELKSTTSGLEDSLQRYRSNLQSLSGSVSALQAKARKLEAWADSVGSAEQGAAR